MSRIARSVKKAQPVASPDFDEPPPAPKPPPGNPYSFFRPFPDLPEKWRSALAQDQLLAQYLEHYGNFADFASSRGLTVDQLYDFLHCELIVERLKRIEMLARRRADFLARVHRPEAIHQLAQIVHNADAVSVNQRRVAASVIIRAAEAADVREQRAARELARSSHSPRSAAPCTASRCAGAAATPMIHALGRFAFPDGAQPPSCSHMPTGPNPFPPLYNPLPHTHPGFDDPGSPPERNGMYQHGADDAQPHLNGRDHLHHNGHFNGDGDAIGRSDAPRPAEAPPESPNHGNNARRRFSLSDIEPHLSQPGSSQSGPSQPKPPQVIARIGPARSPVPRSSPTSPTSRAPDATPRAHNPSRRPTPPNSKRRGRPRRKGP